MFTTPWGKGEYRRLASLGNVVNSRGGVRSPPKTNLAQLMIFTARQHSYSKANRPIVTGWHCVNMTHMADSCYDRWVFTGK